MVRGKVVRRVVHSTLDVLVSSQEEREGEWYAYASVLGVRGELVDGSTREDVERAAIRKLTVDNNKFITSVLDGKVVLE